jgi:signal transduction histidine kinase/Flp pilus assembly protein TadD
MSFSVTNSEKILQFNAMADDYYNRGLYDSAIINYENSYHLANKLGLTEEKCSALKEIGGLYDLKGEYPKALEFLFKALSLAEENDYVELEGVINVNIGIVYFNLKNSDKAIFHYNQALEIGEVEKDTMLLIKALNNLGNVTMTLLNNPIKAEEFFNKSVDLSDKINFETAYMIGLNNLCQIYMNTGREAKALETTKQMLDLSPENAFIYYNLGNLYRQKKETQNAIMAYERSLKYSIYELELRQVLLKDMSDIYAEMNDFETSMEYYKSYITLKDSLHSNDQAKYVLELEARYKNLKKEKVISELKTQNLKSKRLYIVLISSGIILLLVLSLIILIIFNKRIVASQRIKALENEQVMIAASATLSGEEKERARLSRELHDGLGGILSGVKLNLANAIENNVLSSDNRPINLERSYELVVDSISEMRRISNALLPETLLNLGLNTAIKSYCSTFKTNSKGPEINYSFFGDEIRFGRFFELAVYRLAQEIINNSVKHSGASSINIQLVIDKNRLFLGINDNGKGFDIAAAGKNGGKGLTNLKQRAGVYGGRVEIYSEPNAGTEVIAEFDNLEDNKAVYDKSFDS